MKRNRIFRWLMIALAASFAAALVVAALSFILMYLWNWLVPAVIGWKAIDFWQALGLLVLSRILFGLRGGFGHRGHWRGRMAERWGRMTPEEREQFREGMLARCGHRAKEPGNTAT